MKISELLNETPSDITVLDKLQKVIGHKNLVRSAIANHLHVPGKIGPKPDEEMAYFEDEVGNPQAEPRFDNYAKWQDEIKDAKWIEPMKTERGGMMSQGLIKHNTKPFLYFVETDGESGVWIITKMIVDSAVSESTQKFAVHFFDDSGEAYDATQTEIHYETGAKIKDGDTLVIPSEKVVGVACTWPFAVSKEHGALHVVKNGITDDELATSSKVPVQAIMQARKEAAKLDALKESIWSSTVHSKWTPPEDFFTQSADKIARGLKSASKDLKQAMSRLNFYINRAGKNLTDKDHTRLERAKNVLSKLYENKSEE